MRDIRDFEPLWGEWYSVELLGQGSFGRVYKMVKRDLDKEYYAAVKHLSIPSELGEENALYSEGLITNPQVLKTYYEDVLKSLRLEIDLSYKLKGNTNIVSYEDHFICLNTSGVGYDIFIKMELLTGLPDLIRKGGLTVQDVVKLGEDICKALTVLRREKIIHRDIKPGNIFINSRGDYKLGDFGVSQTMERTVNSMSVMGTLSYMAPEVVRGRCFDSLVDIYSLGLVLYRMMNKNRAPFLPPPPEAVTHEMSALAQEKRLRGESLPPPSDADEELARIILKACAFRPEDRWENAEEMGRVLAKYRQDVCPMKTAVPEAYVYHPKERWENAEEMDRTLAKYQQDVPPMGATVLKSASKNKNCTELLGSILHLDVDSEEPTHSEDTIPDPLVPAPRVWPPLSQKKSKVPVIVAAACAVALLVIGAFVLTHTHHNPPPVQTRL